VQASLNHLNFNSHANFQAPIFIRARSLFDGKVESGKAAANQNFNW